MESNMNEHEGNGYPLYFGGVPTAPDVRRIRDLYPDAELKPGQIIRYEDMAVAAGADYGSNRFDSVTDAWRRIVERESGLIIDTERGVGFVVSTDSRKVQLSTRKLRTACRLGRRSYIISRRTNRANLTDDEKKQLDFVTAKSASIAANNLVKPVAELPTL